MNHPRILLVVAALVLATLACQAVVGGGSGDVDGEPVPATQSFGGPQDTQPAETPGEAETENGATGEPDSAGSTRFPMTADAFNIVEVEDGSLVYYTKLPAEQVMQFYRDEYTARGYTEREDLTLAADGVFSMLFDGDPSGKSVVIQSVDLGDGTRTITVRLEDV